MTNEEYQKFIAKIKQVPFYSHRPYLIIALVLASSIFSIWLSSISSGLIWTVAQLLLAINILQWFFLLHDLAHDKYFQAKTLNIVMGHLSSFFVILPFFPWRYIHRAHHYWTGYKDQDPTQQLITKQEVPLFKSIIINVCWRLWIPVCTLSFSFDNFWNIKKLNRLYPEKKFKNYFSICFPIAIHAFVIYLAGIDLYLKSWGFAYLIFLVICDPLLLSQHCGRKQNYSNSERPTMIPFREQGPYTRSLKFPYFIERFIMLGFNKHVLHHLLPALPGHQLIDIEYSDEYEENWWQWLKKSKKMKGVDVLFNEDF